MNKESLNKVRAWHAAGWTPEKYSFSIYLRDDGRLGVIAISKVDQGKYEYSWHTQEEISLAVMKEIENELNGILVEGLILPTKTLSYKMNKTTRERAFHWEQENRFYSDFRIIGPCSFRFKITRFNSDNPNSVAEIALDEEVTPELLEEFSKIMNRTYLKTKKLEAAIEDINPYMDRGNTALEALVALGNKNVKLDRATRCESVQLKGFLPLTTTVVGGMLRVENMKNHVNLRLEEFEDITISWAGQSIKVDKEEFSRWYTHLAMEPMPSVPNIKGFLGSVKRK